MKDLTTAPVSLTKTDIEAINTVNIVLLQMLQKHGNDMPEAKLQEYHDLMGHILTIAPKLAHAYEELS